MAKVFRSGSEGTVGAGLRGVLQGLQLRQQMEEMAAERALKREVADMEKRKLKAEETKLALDVYKSQQGSTVQLPTGQTVSIPGLRGVNYDPATLSLTQGPGFDPGTKPGAVKTPVPPRPSPEDSRLAGEIAKAKSSLAETRPLVTTALTEIQRVEGLNADSYGGVAGNAKRKFLSAFNMGANDPKFKNTTDVVNTMQGMVSRVLKSTFGGQLSDSERSYLNEVYGALPSMSQTERSIAMKNVKVMLSDKLRVAESKVSELTGGAPAPSGNANDPLGLR